MVDVKRHRSPDNPTDVFYTDGTVDYDRVQGNNPLGGGEYPKALYRAGGKEEIHGHMVDTAIVNSDAEEEAYMSDGWRATPAKAAAFGKTLLEKPGDDEKRSPGRLRKTPNEAIASDHEGE